MISVHIIESDDSHAGALADSLRGPEILDLSLDLSKAACDFHNIAIRSGFLF